MPYETFAKERISCEATKRRETTTVTIIDEKTDEFDADDGAEFVPPESSSPAPPTSSERRERKVVLSVFGAIVLATAVAIVVVDPVATGSDLELAQRFVDHVVDGPAQVGGPDGTDTVGYVLAYELFSDAAQDDCSFAEFMATFDDLASEAGYVESAVWDGMRRGSSARREMWFRMTFTGATGRPVERDFRVRLERRADGYVVVGYDITEPEND